MGFTLPGPSSTRTVVVTGASSGIGIEIARQFADRGWHVTLVSRRRDKLEEVAAQLRAPGGTAVMTADLSDADSRSALIDQLAAAGREVSVLVNNAGWSTTGPVWKSNPADEINMIRTDVEAVVHLCSALIPAMVRAGAGGVLNVASTGAFQPVPGQAGYGASKAFVLSYSEALRAELASTGVGVTTLCPGPVETGFAEAAGIDAADAEAALPKFMWVSAAEVARVAVEGLAEGRMVVIPGLANRVAAAFARVVPRSALLPAMVKRHPSLGK